MVTTETDKIAIALDDFRYAIRHGHGCECDLCDIEYVLDEVIDDIGELQDTGTSMRACLWYGLAATGGMIEECQNDGYRRADRYCQFGGKS